MRSLSHPKLLGLCHGCRLSTPRRGVAQLNTRTVKSAASAVSVRPLVKEESLRHLVADDDVLATALREATVTSRQSDALASLGALQQLLPPASVRAVLATCPELLSVDLPSWQTFFSAYGAPPTFLPRLIKRAPRFFLTASLYAAGNVLLCFRALRIDEEDALEMIVMEAPGVLSLGERELAQRLGQMRAAGMDEAAITDAIFRDPMGALCAIYG